ncbi:hypothetical protein NK213_10170 [Sebaldella sp. S0638]|nr:hypothetical protein [Sebaldella sp. S0638]
MEFKEFFQMLTIMLSVFFMYRQIKNSNKQKEKEYDYKRKEKAVEMAVVFQKMLKEVSYIVGILEKTKIKEMYHDRIKFNELKEFDYEELISKFGKNAIREIKGADILETVSINDAANLYIRYNYADENFLKLCDSQETEKISLFIMNDFFERKSRVLNKLEWFSMNFTSGLADESVVYQSLHQVYLSFVKLFHFEISIKNKEGPKDKYYCNIIDLYREWAEHYERALERETNAQREFEDKMNDNIRKTDKFSIKY